MANRIIYPNYKPARYFDRRGWSNADGSWLSKVGAFVNQLLGNATDVLGGISNLKNGSVEAQITEQKRLELEAEKQRSNTILLVAAMAVGAICLILIFKK